MEVVHSPVAAVEAARTDAAEVDHQMAVERLARLRLEQHKSVAIEDRGTVACTWEVVVKQPVVNVSKDDVEFAEDDLLSHFVLE